MDNKVQLYLYYFIILSPSVITKRKATPPFRSEDQIAHKVRKTSLAFHLTVSLPPVANNISLIRLRQRRRRLLLPPRGPSSARDDRLRFNPHSCPPLPPAHHILYHIKSFHLSNFLSNCSASIQRHNDTEYIPTGAASTVLLLRAYRYESGYESVVCDTEACPNECRNACRNAFQPSSWRT